MKIIEYELLNSNDPHALSVEVTRLLNKGWELYGNPFSSFAPNDPWYHYQAVVKREGL